MRFDSLKITSRSRRPYIDAGLVAGLYFLLRIDRLLNTGFRVDHADRYHINATLSSVSVNSSPRNVLDGNLSVVLNPIPILKLHWLIH